MQFLAVLNMFIFTNDLKRKDFFSKMFIPLIKSPKTNFFETLASWEPKTAKRLKHDEVSKPWHSRLRYCREKSGCHLWHSRNLILKKVHCDLSFIWNNAMWNGVLRVVPFMIYFRIHFWSDHNEIVKTNANINVLYAGILRIKIWYFFFV